MVVGWHWLKSFAVAVVFGWPAFFALRNQGFSYDQAGLLGGGFGVVVYSFGLVLTMISNLSKDADFTPFMVHATLIWTALDQLGSPELKKAVKAAMEHLGDAADGRHVRHDPPSLTHDSPSRLNSEEGIISLWKLQGTVFEVSVLSPKLYYSHEWKSFGSTFNRMQEISGLTRDDEWSRLKPTTFSMTLRRNAGVERGLEFAISGVFNKEYRRFPLAFLPIVAFGEYSWIKPTRSESRNEDQDLKKHGWIYEESLNVLKHKYVWVTLQRL